MTHPRNGHGHRTNQYSYPQRHSVAPRSSTHYTPHPSFPRHEQYQHHNYNRNNNYNNNHHRYRDSHHYHHHPPPHHSYYDKPHNHHNNNNNRNSHHPSHSYHPSNTHHRNTNNAHNISSHENERKTQRMTDVTTPTTSNHRAKRNMNHNHMQLNEIIPIDIKSEYNKQSSQHGANTNKSNNNKHLVLPTNYKLLGTHKNKYRIIKCIKKGRFNHVYSAYDETIRQKLAIKVGANDKEYGIMRSFNNSSPYICKVYDFGKLPKDIGIGNYLCMELCDEKNLNDKRNECPTKCFGIQKGALIGIEIILSLKKFHQKGYIHRDIKPSNFIFPLQPNWANHLYIAGFGSSKRYNIIPKQTEFIDASLLYASITAHNNPDLSPLDDLWSALFVIIDMSTNSLPWKETYFKLENQFKLRRQEVFDIKKKFIEYMLSEHGVGDSNNHNKKKNNKFGDRFRYKMPGEYRDFIKKLQTTGYNDIPKYDDLIDILRTIGMNDKYKQDQYVSDHAPEPVDIPIHSNFDILRDELCKLNILKQCQEGTECWLGVHPLHKEYTYHSRNDHRRKVSAPLCKDYILNDYCSSNRPRGSWCNMGYHWTLNDEMHFRNHGELPSIYTGIDGICHEAFECMGCSKNDCNLQHPQNGMKYIWNNNNTFSVKKKFWGKVDIKKFNDLGLYPLGINYKREKIDINNFAQYLNEYTRNKYECLVKNTIFEANDFMDGRVIDKLFKLNVSQSMNILKDIHSKYDPYHNIRSVATNYSLLRQDAMKRKEFLIDSLKDAFNAIQCPSECKLYPNEETKRKEMQKSIKYPALYQSEFTLEITTKCHKNNDEMAKRAILRRLEDFVRNARGKTIGNGVISILMSIPCKYAIQVLDELQNMGLQKIAVIEVAMKRAVAQKQPLIEKELQIQQQQQQQQLLKPNINNNNNINRTLRSNNISPNIPTNNTEKRYNISTKNHINSHLNAPNQPRNTSYSKSIASNNNKTPISKSNDNININRAPRSNKVSSKTSTINNTAHPYNMNRKSCINPHLNSRNRSRNIPYSKPLDLEYLDRIMDMKEPITNVEQAQCNKFNYGLIRQMNYHNTSYTPIKTEKCNINRSKSGIIPKKKASMKSSVRDKDAFNLHRIPKHPAVMMRPSTTKKVKEPNQPQIDVEVIGRPKKHKKHKKSSSKRDRKRKDKSCKKKRKHKKDKTRRKHKHHKKRYDTESSDDSDDDVPILQQLQRKHLQNKSITNNRHSVATNQEITNDESSKNKKKNKNEKPQNIGQQFHHQLPSTPGSINTMQQNMNIIPNTMHILQEQNVLIPPNKANLNAQPIRTPTPESTETSSHTLGNINNINTNKSAESGEAANIINNNNRSTQSQQQQQTSNTATINDIANVNVTNIHNMAMSQMLNTPNVLSSNGNQQNTSMLPQTLHHETNRKRKLDDNFMANPKTKRRKLNKHESIPDGTSSDDMSSDDMGSILDDPDDTITMNEDDMSFKSHMSHEDAMNLSVGDMIDHKKTDGPFVYATVSEKQGTNLKIHYDGWSTQVDTWSDFTKEIHRFARAGSISKRPEHRFHELKEGDYIDINPIQKHRGWKSGQIQRLSFQSGQVEVAYKWDKLYLLYWTHLDNKQEIAEHKSKSYTAHACSMDIDAVDQQTLRLSIDDKREENDGESSDDYLEILEAKKSIHCPLTRCIMKHPVKSSNCGHVFEESAIVDYIQNKRNKMEDVDELTAIECPLPGCSRLIEIDYLSLDEETKQFIKDNQPREIQEFDNDSEDNDQSSDSDIEILSNIS